MFTGLVRGIGKIASITPFGGGVRLTIDISSLDAENIEIGASIAICGVCLTVTEINGKSAAFDAVSETVTRSTLGEKKPGDIVNLEPALRAGDPLDGHIVQGHVDAVGALVERIEKQDSTVLRFSMPTSLAPLVAEKGSIAIDGISLTVVEALRDSFTVSIIPHTMVCTTLEKMSAGSRVNLEADVLARYAARYSEMSSQSDGLSMDALRENGFA